ncbi:MULTISPECIES: ABC transporter ATP-binding protein [unclassified Microbacterium]|uniref:ABC transporter ATP-binding protein n=1 Tax=unclassified Microbacterium TaxID=2609290 RepID=UPI00301B2EF0
MNATEQLLSIQRLTVDVPRGDGATRLVDRFDLDIAPGERVALVGESGSGKSVTARAIVGLNEGMRTGGSVTLEGEQLVGAPDRRMQRVRGRRIGFVFQDPLRSLNPVKTIGSQVAEPLRLAGATKQDAWRRARETLDDLGVVNAAERMRAYPFEFSGGMRQRVAIAIAMVADPRLLIADEPTTALDTIVQRRVLGLLDAIARDRGVAVLLITHDLGVVAGFADRVAVMYSGRKVEDAPVRDIYARPAHPYTQGLLAAVPRIDRPVRRLPAMPGSPVPPSRRGEGCAFAPRCALAEDRCREAVPPLDLLSPRHEVACFVAADRVAADRVAADQVAVDRVAADQEETS